MIVVAVPADVPRRDIRSRQAILAMMFLIVTVTTLQETFRSSKEFRIVVQYVNAIDSLLGDSLIYRGDIANTSGSWNTTFSPREQYHDEYGYPTVEHLPLWNWETQSINSTSKFRTCKPPPGVPSVCCIGSISTGGLPKWKPRECRVADHFASENWTKTYMEALPYAFGRPCDSCEILHLLAQFNWTLGLQGDSVSHQTWVGFHCELARRGYPTSVHDKTIRATPENKGYAQLSQISTMTVNVSNSKTVTVRFYRAYRPTAYLLNRTLRENDILVFDHGLHYPANRAQRNFQHDMSYLLKSARDQSNRVKLLAWRETTAQHFDLPGGYYLRGMTDADRPCVPSNENFTAAAYQGKQLSPQLLEILSNAYPASDFISVAQKTANITWLDVSDPNFLNTPPLQYSKEIVFLPYRDYTKALHHMHDRECTHYCANPFIWQPIWRSLRLAMQRTAKYLPLVPTEQMENDG
jgi:hypothetical protein